MTTPSLLERYRDLVTGRVPTLAAEVMQRTLERLQRGAMAQAVAGDRQHTATVLPLLRPGPHGLAAAFSAALRQQLKAEFERKEPDDERADAAGAAPSIDSLTLVDDQQIEEDIEVARVIQRVDTAAELELRELQALCATLRGAPAAQPEVVPLRPEVCARALSRALQALHLDRGARMMVLREVGSSLAEGLQALVRDQVRELRRWGVEPLPYQLRIAPDLQATAAAAGAATPAAGARDDAALQRLLGELAGGGPGGERLVAQLLAQVAEQAKLEADLAALLQRLAAPALRSARRAGGGALASFEHPMWRLADRIAALGSVQAASAAAPPLAVRLAPVLARLEREADASPEAYQRALAEVDALASGWADSQLADAGAAAAAPDAAPVDLMVEPPGSLPTDWGGEGSLPTVPMQLAQPGDDPHQQWLDGLREGDLLRLFVHAGWLTARLAGRSGGHVLLVTRRGAPIQTLSRAALYRLHASGLATTIESVALVRQAALALKRP